MTGWIAETLFETTLLMALVLLLRHPVRQAFGAKAAYLLWLAPLLRLVMPPLPIEVPAVSYYLETTAGAALPAAIASAPSGPGLFATLAAIWLAGALVFIAIHVARCWKAPRSMAPQPPDSSFAASSCQTISPTVSPPNSAPSLWLTKRCTIAAATYGLRRAR